MCCKYFASPLKPIACYERTPNPEFDMSKRRLLVSVRGPKEAVAAAQGGAHIADVEFPASALGTPYPLNIKAVRDALDAAGFSKVPISTNIGEEQPNRSTACQAALGVAIAGADYVKCGLAELTPKAAARLGGDLVRTVRNWCPDAKVYPAVFPEEEFVDLFDPLTDGPALVKEIDCDGLLIDTFHKNIGMGLLDYYSIDDIQKFVDALHGLEKDAWVAGSVTLHELPTLWRTGVDVVCVRGAACAPSAEKDRFGAVSTDVVKELVATLGV
jgi:(5-formylfuran-3-yl)methyl phosphate synthase